MSRRPRIYYNESQIALMWDRWQRGESLHQIARLFDRHHAAVRRILFGSNIGIRAMRRARCRTKPSIAASSSRRAVP